MKKRKIGFKVKTPEGIEIESHGLLSVFITNKVESYVEPTREGTPKGEPIGFSLRKYTATFLELTSGGLKETAKKLNISYGLLRKWKTEEAFQKHVQRNYEEFMTIFSNFMSDQTGELDRSVEDPKHFRQTVDFVKDKIIFDAHLYSHRLRAKTVWKLRELVRQYPIHLPLFMEIESNLWLQWANTSSERRSALRKAEELKQQTIRLYNNLILEFVLSILRQKIISNKDKNRAISFLESLKNFLDRIPA